MKLPTAKLQYEEYDDKGNMLDRVTKLFYENKESDVTSFISEMYFFVRKCMCVNETWNKYFFLPGDDHVHMILDTSVATTKEHLDEAEQRIKQARKRLRKRK